MKILIVYIPRSKSTLIHDVLVKKFRLQGLMEPLLQSRRSNQNYDEYPKLINEINQADNICVKVCINDFIDVTRGQVRNEYQLIDYDRFDSIIFIRRDSVLNTVLSYNYLDQFNSSEWHRRKGQTLTKKPYTLELSKIYYLLRSYRLVDNIKKYIVSRCSHARVLDYEYESVEQQLINDFELTSSDFDIDILAHNIDYTSLATNYEQIKNQIDDMYATVMSATDQDINTSGSFFWNNPVDYR